MWISPTWTYKELIIYFSKDWVLIGWKATMCEIFYICGHVKFAVSNYSNLLMLNGEDLQFYMINEHLREFKILKWWNYIECYDMLLRHLMASRVYEHIL